MRKKNESDCQRSYSLSLSLSLFFMWAQLGSPPERRQSGREPTTP
ncbi:MAG: hypothetical protein R2756_04155 [Bacteroidales bacterium]